MSDFSDSSQSGVISPATSFIENFHKKNGTAASSANSTPSISSTIGSTSPAHNGGSGSVGGGQITVAVPTGNGSGSGTLTSSSLGRQINTSSSSSVKETSSTSSQQVCVCVLFIKSYFSNCMAYNT